MRKNSEILAEAKELLKTNATTGTLYSPGPTGPCYCLLGAVYAAETGKRGEEVEALEGDDQYGERAAYIDRPVLEPLAAAIKETGFEYYGGSVNTIWNFNDRFQKHTVYLVPEVANVIDRAVAIAKEQENA